MQIACQHRSRLLRRGVSRHFSPVTCSDPEALSDRGAKGGTGAFRLCSAAHFGQPSAQNPRDKSARVWSRLLSNEEDEEQFVLLRGQSLGRMRSRRGYSLPPANGTDRTRLIARPRALHFFVQIGEIRPLLLSAGFSLNPGKSSRDAKRGSQMGSGCFSTIHFILLTPACCARSACRRSKPWGSHPPPGTMPNRPLIIAA